MGKFTSKVKSSSTMGAFMRKLKSLETYEAQAGFDSRKHPESGDALALVALANEEGWGITPRPFMSGASMNMAYNGGHLFDATVRNCLYGNYTAKDVLNDLSEDMQEAIRNSIQSGDWPVTSNPTPLQKTDFMQDNISSYVKKKTG